MTALRLRCRAAVDCCLHQRVVPCKAYSAVPCLQLSCPAPGCAGWSCCKKVVALAVVAGTFQLSVCVLFVAHAARSSFLGGWIATQRIQSACCHQLAAAAVAWQRHARGFAHQSHSFTVAALLIVTSAMPLHGRVQWRCGSLCSPLCPQATLPAMARRAAAIYHMHDVILVCPWCCECARQSWVSGPVQLHLYTVLAEVVHALVTVPAWLAGTTTQCA